MSNHVQCATCPTVDTRGNMHIRSQAFVQVAYCPECWKWRQRMAELSWWAHGGIAA